MYTIETAIVMPVILFFILVSLCICLKYTEIISCHADVLRESALQNKINNADIARGGAVLYDFYEKHTG